VASAPPLRICRLHAWNCLARSRRNEIGIMAIHAKTVRAAAHAACLAFVANAVLDREGQMFAVAYGDSVAVRDSLASFATLLVTAPVDSQFAPTPVVRKSAARSTSRPNVWRGLGRPLESSGFLPPYARPNHRET
jgi:hypothetical protein